MDQDAKQQAKVGDVWNEIRDTWGKIEEKPAPETAGEIKSTGDKSPSGENFPVIQGSRLAKDVNEAGGLTQQLVEKIHQCYDFCAGFSPDDLKDMGTLETFKVRAAMESQAANDGTGHHAAGEGEEHASFGSSFGSWESFSPGSQKTWPDHKHNVVFGPRLIRPVMALFLNGKWFHDGTNKPIEGVTKFQHIEAPEDWV